MRRNGLHHLVVYLPVQLPSPLLLLPSIALQESTQLRG
jgi:hypothetical protein